MHNKICCAIFALLAAVCLLSVDTANARNRKVRKQNAISDTFVYAQVFHLANNFDNVENARDEPTKNFFKNYFARKAELTEEQSQFLKTVAYNFTSAFNLISYKQKLELSLHYKNELKNFFGAADFERFDQFVKREIAPKISPLKRGNARMVTAYGVSSVSINRRRASAKRLFRNYRVHPK